MGEYAEMILDGTMCEGCGEWMGDDESPGFTQRCSSCSNSDEEDARRDKQKAREIAERLVNKMLAALENELKAKFIPAVRDVIRPQVRGIIMGLEVVGGQITSPNVEKQIRHDQHQQARAAERHAKNKQKKVAANAN